MTSRNPVEADFELVGGSWQPDRTMVLRWHPRDPEAFQRMRTGEACGTDAGYQRHQAAREPVCTPCQSAHNASAKAWRARHGAR